MWIIYGFTWSDSVEHQQLQPTLFYIWSAGVASPSGRLARSGSAPHDSDAADAVEKAQLEPSNQSTSSGELTRWMPGFLMNR